jgi:hypothetical protein
MEAPTLDAILFGGILVRLAKGASVSMEQARVEDGLGRPEHFAMHIPARVALVKPIRSGTAYGGFRRSAAGGARRAPRGEFAVLL